MRDRNEPSVRLAFKVADGNAVDDEIVRFEPVIECHELLKTVSYA